VCLLHGLSPQPPSRVPPGLIEPRVTYTIPPLTPACPRALRNMPYRIMLCFQPDKHTLCVLSLASLTMCQVELLFLLTFFNARLGQSACVAILCDRASLRPPWRWRQAVRCFQAISCCL